MKCFLYNMLIQWKFCFALEMNISVPYCKRKRSIKLFYSFYLNVFEIFSNFELSKVFQFKFVNCALNFVLPNVHKKYLLAL